MPRPPSQAPKRVQVQGNDAAPRVWLLQDGQPVAVDVRTGATNGRVTEITGGNLKAGMQVITETLSTPR
jgi:HlyD family secretion protein